MEALIDLRNIHVRHGDFEVLRDVSVSFPTGDTTFIIGPSGSGKSTLLKVAAGLIPPDSGEALVGNKSWMRMSNQELREFRLYAAYVFQDSALWQNMSIMQNLLLPLQHHFPRMSVEFLKKKVTAALAKVGYSERTDLRPAELSSGEQKLVGFARAMVLDPMLYFLDSPLSLVDGANANRLVDLCAEFKRQHKSLVIVTNKVEFCFNLADRVCVMEKGRIVAHGDLDKVAADWPESVMGRLSNAQRAILEKRAAREAEGKP
jgi:ABC-type transporter Mla maintaining outer membrane lipid asymmetry ATPase subunit MlaF